MRFSRQGSAYLSAGSYLREKIPSTKELIVQMDGDQPCELRVHPFFANDRPCVIVKCEAGSATVQLSPTDQEFVAIRDAERADRFMRAHRATRQAKQYRQSVEQAE